MDKNEAKQYVSDWLAHPTELGARPYKLEFTSEFTDEDGIHCLIFKYKKSMLAPWLLAIASDSGIFSEMKKYNAAAERKDAEELLNFLKQYWKNRASETSEREKAAAEAKPFMAFALLKDATWKLQDFLSAFEKEWQIALTAEGENPETTICATGDLRVMLALMEMPVPNGEAERNAANNYMWKEAAEVTKSHKAHMVISMPGKASPAEKGLFFSKVLATLCRNENTIGVYTNRVVLEPKFILSMTDFMSRGKLPIFSLVWFGVATSEQGVSLCTNGMRCFGKEEMEILDSKQTVGEVRKILLNVVDYVLSNDAFLHDGETIGYTADTRIRIVKSAGVHTDGDTLKLIV